ncbi:MAG: hypothetical protein KAQ92_06100, partial [Candidatus Aenigmarchaeota archaeon]|nr:hypothetical protein [Candidatus Aenigmarchaeota archaeon]
MTRDKISNAKEFLSALISKGLLIEPATFESIKEMFQNKANIACLVAESICNDSSDEINSNTIKEKIKFFEDQEKTKQKVTIKKTIKKTRKDYDAQVKIRKIKENTAKKNTTLFCDYFLSRYEKIKKILVRHLDLTNLVSINNLNSSKRNGDISIIAIVKDKIEAKTGTILLDVEDKTGAVRVFVKEADLCQNIINDEVIGIQGNHFSGGIIAKKIIFPEIPFPNEVNKIEEPLKAVFISDVHLGSKEYLKPVEEKFL